MNIINLQEKEISEAKSITNDFRSVHDEIMSIQEKMDGLQKESSFLIEKLNHIRSREENFIEDLKNKYGKGSLNPFDLTYTKE
jgi:oligoribonuclease NrnB/cAMP/cGMP phosphodiesterase (DHH superfamily)